jgi:hypothetical protein
MVLLAGCAPAPPQPAPTPPAPVPAPPPPPRAEPAPNWRDAALTPGDWTWSAASGRSTAQYGAPGAPPAMTLTCDRAAGTITLARPGGAGAPAPVVITTTTARRVFSGEAPAGGGGGIAIVIPARDALLDAIAFSDGRFMVEVPGDSATIVPSWPEVARVIEDCRG